MQTVQRVVGAMLAFDLGAAVLLAVLIALVGRRGSRVPLSVLLGALIFLGICSTLIYGSLWMIVRLAS